MFNAQHSPDSYRDSMFNKKAIRLADGSPAFAGQIIFGESPVTR